METIVLEVDDIVAKNWRCASEEQKKQFNITINKLLKKAFIKNDVDFWQFIHKVGKQAESKGLTEEQLNILLN